MSAILLWYRNDLRLRDHQALHYALNLLKNRTDRQLLPLYCFDPRQFGATSFGFPKTGAFRAQFLWESVADLRQDLQNHGADLVVRWGEPEQIIPELALQAGVTTVVCHGEVLPEELAVERQVKLALERKQIDFHSIDWGATLLNPADYGPESPSLFQPPPRLFTHFRKAVERCWTVSDPLAVPAQLPPLPPAVTGGDLPAFSRTGLQPPSPDPRAVLPFQGGSTAGIDRLQQYFWQGDFLKIYKETRNGLLGADYSSKFSPWLALGCLSPRWVYQQVKQYEDQRCQNPSTYWLVFELLWRDFFRFTAAQAGSTLFRSSGIQGLDVPWTVDWELFDRWRSGQTGYPFVDANLRELAATGFMSNRGRQNVASFLTKNLGLDWRMGAEWFESLLIDYDGCSNWGNWNYTAGVGNDGRGFRYFNLVKQARDYDPQGDYVRHWIPELAAIPGDRIHQPWMLTQADRDRWGLAMPLDYPDRCVDFWQSLKHQEQQFPSDPAPQSQSRRNQSRKRKAPRGHRD
ncbi:MAG: DASH family cryptochrome [Prochlorothrix sp.]